MIKLLTVTGGRPLAWELCKLWMSRQTLKPDAWIIVDDCDPISNLRGIDIPVLIIRPQPRWKPGDNTQQRNLLQGLENVSVNDKLIIIEDDDWYRDDYVKTMSAFLDRNNLVGERNALYYHVGQRVYRYCQNRTHASLCSTAMTGDAITKFKRTCEKNVKFIDLELWRSHRGKLYDTTMTVGIKGLPGRPGIGAGHRMKGTKDPNLGKLRSRIGGDVRFYEGSL